MPVLVGVLSGWPPNLYLYPNVNFMVRACLMTLAWKAYLLPPPVSNWATHLDG